MFVGVCEERGYEGGLFIAKNNVLSRGNGLCESVAKGLRVQRGAGGGERTHEKEARGDGCQEVGCE